jgi:hypothetical protein
LRSQTQTLQFSRRQRRRATFERQVSKSEIDPHTGKSNPEVDMVVLVDLALAKSGTGTIGTEELHKACGRALRRFNPTFPFMVSQIDDRRVLKGGTDGYPARGFLMIDADRVALHRFAGR